MRQKLTQYVLYLFLFSSLCVSYIYYIFPVWEYYGFTLSVNELKLIESVIILLVVVTFLERRPKLPSDFLLHIQFIFPFLPMLVLYGLTNESRGYIIACGLSFFVIKFISKKRIKFYTKGIVNEQFLLTIVLLLSWLNIGSLVSIGLLQYLNFDLYRVYEFRRLAGELLPNYEVYFNAIVGAAFLPLAFILAIKRKSLYLSVLALSGSIMMFALTHYKAVLFYPFVAYGLYIVIKKPKLINYVLMVLIALTLYSLIEHFTETLSDNVGSLVIRRMFYIPAHANFFYYDFFSINEKVYLSNSKVTLGLLTYPYDMSTAMLIGDEMRADSGVRANTGWLGTSYMHFGYFGIFLFSIIVGILFSLIDKIAKNKDMALIQVITFAPFYALFVSSDLFTAILTHGLGMSLILAWALKTK